MSDMFPDIHDTPASEADIRAALRQAADLAARYLATRGEYPVIPNIAPGDVAAALPDAPPEVPETLEAVLGDYRRLIEPNVTHWNHPGFLAYFAITGSTAGVMGETLSAALKSNAMLWKSGPAPTELEERVCDWLRQMVSLPTGFVGHINDTASIATMLALAAARERAFPSIRQDGMSGRTDLPRMTVYASEQAHSSVDKAMVALGLGLAQLRRIPTDDAFRAKPDALREMIAADRAAGMRPIAVVATLGTTSTTSVDPAADMAVVARESGAWLHVDAAYAGPAAISPALRPLMRGWELADSIVLNPHKWMFTPVDCSVTLVRDVETWKRAFSITPEYLRTDVGAATNLMDYGVQLGRRFRALKLWMVIRAYGVSGLRTHIERHCALARELGEWIDGDDRFERVAPTPFSLVCFRALPQDANATATEIDALNERMLARINTDGAVFLSHTKLNGRFTLRVAIGNQHTNRATIENAWTIIRCAYDEVAGA
ncbi:MAG: aspartate aminotransferase family protein [Phycisphaerales bacterium]|nr:aspartate aminotransferase family protein [Phycisphaerales bacterium]